MSVEHMKSISLHVSFFLVVDFSCRALLDRVLTSIYLELLSSSSKIQISKCVKSSTFKQANAVTKLELSSGRPSPRYNLFLLKEKQKEQHTEWITNRNTELMPPDNTAAKIPFN